MVGNGRSPTLRWGHNMIIKSHIKELKYRLLYILIGWLAIFTISLFYGEALLNFALDPLPAGRPPACECASDALSTTGGPKLILDEDIYDHPDRVAESHHDRRSNSSNEGGDVSARRGLVIPDCVGGVYDNDTPCLQQGSPGGAPRHRHAAIFTSLTEGLNSYIRLGLIVSNLAILPIGLSSLLDFTKSGLYFSEYKKWKKASFFYLLGYIIAQYSNLNYFLPFLVNFFITYESVELHFEPKINEFLDLTLTTIWIFFFTSLLPFIYAIIYWVCGADPTQSGKYFSRPMLLLTLLILTSLLTPPDIFSLIFLTTILFSTWELTICSLLIQKVYLGNPGVIDPHSGGKLSPRL